MTPAASEARRLAAKGYKLCKLKSMSKRPHGTAWQRRPLTDPEQVDNTASGYGILLAANRLCSIDPDRLELARAGLARCGFDLDELLAAGVRTTSTRPGSGGRSTFRDTGGLSWIRFRSKRAGVVLELRARSTNLQDCLPGTTYNSSDGDGPFIQEYVNGRKLDEAPPLPTRFEEWWRLLSSDLEALHAAERAFFGEEDSPVLAASVGEGAGMRLAFESTRRGEFNRTHRVEELLERHGYTNHRGRWAPPTATGAPGVRPIPGKDGLWQSDHASDPLSGTFDAWTAFVQIDHDGDFDAAERAYDQQSDEARLAEFSSGEKAKPSAGKPTVLYDAADLLATEMQPVNYVVQDWLPEGMLMLVAAPKIGKSTLILQIAVAKAKGMPFWGSEVRQGKVLYIDLETNLRRLRRKLDAAGLKDIPRGQLLIPEAWPRGAAGVQQIRRTLDEVPGIALVVIDTLQRFREVGKGNRSAYEADYEALAPLQQICRERPGLAIVCVHHKRKQASDDPIDSINGSAAIAGAADGIWLMSRDKKGNFSLDVRARDWERDQDTFRIERANGVWRLADDEKQEPTAKEKEILSALDLGREMTAQEVGKALGVSRQAAGVRLERMEQLGQVRRVGPKWRALP